MGSETFHIVFRTIIVEEDTHKAKKKSNDIDPTNIDKKCRSFLLGTKLLDFHFQGWERNDVCKRLPHAFLIKLSPSSPSQFFEVNLTDSIFYP